MKKALLFLIITAATIINVSAQNRDSIAVIKLDENNIIEFKNNKKGDGLSINVAGYGISLGDSDADNDDRLDGGKTMHLHAIGEVSLGFTSLITTGGSSSTGANSNFPDLDISRSIYFSTNILGFKATGNRTFSLYSAINLKCYNFTFADDITVDYQDGKIVTLPIDENIKKSKLTTAYIGIPLSLKIKLARKFYIAPSIYGGVNINAHTKYKRPIVKSERFRAVNQAIASTSLRIGYNGFGLFADYSITDIFKNGTDYNNTKAFTVGVTALF